MCVCVCTHVCVVCGDDRLLFRNQSVLNFLKYETNSTCKDFNSPLLVTSRKRAGQFPISNTKTKSEEANVIRKALIAAEIAGNWSN